MHRNSERVIEQFFQSFYFHHIEKEYKRIDGGPSSAMFWFSIMDFYSGIYYIGETGIKQYRYNEQKRGFKLAHDKAVELYMKQYFPILESEYFNILYKVFRNGMVHQIAPKKGDIDWYPEKAELLWVDNSNGNIMAYLNLYKLQELTYNSFMAFYQDVINSRWDWQCDNVCRELIDKYDSLEDEKELKKAYQALKTKGISI
ncbi:hypothetical protein BWI96_18850 [Siphonobacter sp. SORGH_AS_0500]|uniref:hypothetical protein n=1 Tax=Siphonobacter sp. SORGH_AS_0500 TaxID=1864824 RepID=UPI000CC5E306|nr:hypothetical protein [Siphonobacter sp. SORGH_AS_0500]PKK35113.1 hypothetical protein BWI96_18850 [Siphonobacter sp. SORGH_AS_0500]